MPRTLNQRMADAHEADMAEVIDGRVQKGSGNQWHAQGDLKNGEHLVAYPITGDCKATLGKSISLSREMWNKITEQTYDQNPALFLRWYRDESLRQVDTDLAVTSVSLFRQVLGDARQWQAVLDEFGDDTRIPELEEILKVFRAGMAALGIEKSSPGCDCCR